MRSADYRGFKDLGQSPIVQWLQDESLLRRCHGYDWLTTALTNREDTSTHDVLNETDERTDGRADCQQHSRRFTHTSRPSDVTHRLADVDQQGGRSITAVCMV